MKSLRPSKWSHRCRVGLLWRSHEKPIWAGTCAAMFAIASIAMSAQNPQSSSTRKVAARVPIARSPSQDA